MGNKNFVHLHVHTEYSMLDGAARVDELVSTAARHGMPAIAITDHGVTYGLIEFHEACVRHGIKPILGCELYLARDSRFSRMPGDDSAKTIQHLTVLAKNQKGYQNLLSLATAASLEGQYYKPRVDMELMAQYSEGLIGTTGCLSGNVPRLLLANQLDEANAAAKNWQDIFGADSFFIELQDHGIGEQGIVNKHLVEMSHNLKIPMIATNDLHYTSKSDAEAHDALLCIQTGSTTDDPNRFKFSGDEFFLKTRDEMESALGDYPDALDRTLEVAEMCDVPLTFGELRLPNFAPPDGSSMEDYLVSLTFDGARQRYGAELTTQVKERLDYELGVITKMGFPGYFLIVADLIHWARSHGIRVGPGRGSAGGSCVAYCLGIVTLDPIAYNLMFERFLNHERHEMPDIDIDFDERRRPEVIRYLRDKYGHDRVAQIITFSTIKGKRAIRDAARVLGYPYALGDKLAKMFPRALLGKDPALEVCFKKSSDSRWVYAFNEAAELRAIYQTEDDSRRVLDTALKLEGLKRQTSTHAAAVVISREPLVNYTALQRTDSDDIVTQYDMKAIDKLGLLKIDILGLGNLSVIEHAVGLIKASGGSIDFDIDNLALDDPRVFELLQSGDADGVFQLESEGMKRLLKQLKPDRFEDIVALIALFRPGPMNEIPKFIAGKHDPSSISYMHPLLKEVLEDTYGVIVYQEQILALLQRVGGYTAAQADIVRQAIGKKIVAMMAKEKPRFLDGAKANGVDQAVALKLWDLIEPFAGYSFNRAHSACYATIAYQTAYLKAHYPLDYVAALLTYSQDSTNSREDRTKYLSMARRMGLKVFPPSINESQKAFARDQLDDSAVRFGLRGIRNVGDAVVESILAARVSGGSFKSFIDFCSRVDLAVLNKRTVESLVKAGAFDNTGDSRGGLLRRVSNGHHVEGAPPPLMVFERIIDACLPARKKEMEGYVSLFADSSDESSILAIDIPIEKIDLPKAEALGYEKEMLGHFVSEHPLLEMSEVLACQTNATISSLSEKRDGEVVVIGAIITKSRKRFNKRGEAWYVLQVEDLDAVCEVTVFPKAVEQSADLIAIDQIVCIKGRVDFKETPPILVATEMRRPDLNIVQNQLTITVAATQCDAQFVDELKSLLMDHPGEVAVVLKLVSTGEPKLFRLPGDLLVSPDDSLIDRLRLLAGHGAVTSSVRC